MMVKIQIVRDDGKTVIYEIFNKLDDLKVVWMEPIIESPNLLVTGFKFEVFKVAR